MDAVTSTLTPEQREVVERVRAKMGASSRQHGRAEAAARYAHDHRVSVTEAAKRFGANRGNTYAWYRRLYPNEPHTLGRRRKASP